jgi:hypothetical protein
VSHQEFPEWIGHAILVNGLTYAQNPACGTAEWISGPAPRYKSNSAPKLLISLNLHLCCFRRHSMQGLDSSGLGAFRRPPINKVIHKKPGQTAKGFQINDLALLSNVTLKK